MSRLQQALLARRERFNTAFALARRSRPRLDQQAFSQHLLEVVDPIVERCRENSDQVVEVLYDLSLELVGTELLGRYPAVVRGWERLLPRWSAWLSAQPRRLTASLTNALVELSPYRPQFWIDKMGELTFESLEQLLACGQVLAWKAGLAHYREGALEVARQLPSELCQSLLGCSPQVLDELVEQPWRDPQGGQPERFQVVARVGSFRGFGGLFIRPPEVTSAGRDRFFVSDGEERFLLAADLFGATFHRVDLSLPAAPDAERDILFGDGGLRLEGQWLEGNFRQPKSVAVGPTTLAMTFARSHSVWLVARC